MILYRNSMVRARTFIAAVTVLFWGYSESFVLHHPSATTNTLRSTVSITSVVAPKSSPPPPRVQTADTSLFAVPEQKLTAAQQSRRQELLARNGPHFQLNRFQGGVEFGSSAQLVTKLDDEVNPEGIAEWLSDGQGLALSIWDEKMMKDLGNSVYRLQTMTLQFITITLSPSVDVQMWTHTDPNTGEPVFSIQSVDFDPNIQLLPGVGISASSLGLHIDVVGELRPSQDGTGVTGSISFATRGNLPPPMRVLPESPLRMASNAINDTIVSFAVESFQKGAIRKYQEFRAIEEAKANAARRQEQEE